MGLLNMFRREPVVRVRMLMSVDSEHVAGESYDIPVALADRYIIRGYAAGNLSREFTADELVELRGNPQVVGV